MSRRERGLAGSQPRWKPITRIKSPSERGKITARTISRNNSGIDKSTSTMRIIIVSTQPPKKPAIAPHKTPTTVAMAAAAKPTSRDV